MTVTMDDNGVKAVTSVKGDKPDRLVGVTEDSKPRPVFKLALPNLPNKPTSASRCDYGCKSACGCPPILTVADIEAVFG